MKPLQAARAFKCVLFKFDRVIVNLGLHVLRHFFSTL
jgi:hypothetical protein